MTDAPPTTRTRPISFATARDGKSREERVDPGPARDAAAHRSSVVGALGALMLGQRISAMSARRV